MLNLVSLLAGAMLAAWTSSSFPQAGASFPTRPVRMVVAFTPGGGTDIIARILAQKLGERWGQPVVVENRVGAAGNIGTEMVARSAPDGHTMLMAFSSHASNPALYGKLPFDINKDFSSITLVGTAPMVVIASPSFPAKTLAALIEYARSRPGAVKFGSSGIGTPVHRAGDDCHPRRGDRDHLRGGADRTAAFQGGQAESSRRRRPQPLSRAARGADGGGGGPPRLRNRILVRAARAGRHAGAAGRAHPARRRRHPHDAGNEGEPARAGLRRVGQQSSGTFRADQERLRALGESDPDRRRETGMIRSAVGANSAAD